MQPLFVPLTHQLNWCHTKAWEEPNPAPKHPEHLLHHCQAPSARHSKLCSQIPNSTSSHPTAAKHSSLQDQRCS